MTHHTRKIDLRKWAALGLAVLGAVLAIWGMVHIWRAWTQNDVLRRIIGRLEADSRVAQVLVTQVQPDAATGETWTTIKFLEFDSQGRPLAPRYFKFSGNVIQFQSLVVRFEDLYVERGDRVRGKSAYLFLKVFFLDGPRTESYDITSLYQVPDGYKIGSSSRVSAGFEKAFWEKFWELALDPAAAKKAGVKNAQIEAPGTKFVPGSLYTIKIEHDGGMRIDAEPLAPILKGERIPE